MATPKTVTVPCRRCGGEGILWQHKNVMGGECFRCHGVGTETITAAAARRRETEAARQAAKAEAEKARCAETQMRSDEVSDRILALYADHPEITRMTSPQARRDIMARQLFCRDRGISHFDCVADLAKYL